MQNRDRDKVSRNTDSTDSGDVNRDTSRIGNRSDESSSEFGQNIGRSENLNEPSGRRENIGSEGMRGGSESDLSDIEGEGSELDRDRSGSSRGRH